MSKMAKYLNQELVTRYAQLSADLKKMEEQKQKMREEIIEGFKAGEKCPRQGPYLVSITYQERRNISWKDEFVRLAREQLGKAWVKYRTKIENEAPVVNTPMVLTDVNPDYEVEAPVGKRGVA
jgi:hypothetical protein